MMKKMIIILFVALSLAACGAKSQIQDTPALHLSRDFGYSSLGGNEIQGSFTIAYSGPADVIRVVFLIDGETMADVQGTYPFTAKFNTGSYSIGDHTLNAIGYTQAGAELPAKTVQIRFVSASEGWKTSLKIVGPILGLVVLVTVVGIGLPLLLNRGKNEVLAPGTPRNYGIRGGAICSRCQRPFVLHFFSLNMGIHKLDRCPYCGKWGLVRVRSLSDLRAAERAEIEQSKPEDQPPESSAEEKLQKDLEDSRYQDL